MSLAKTPFYHGLSSHSAEGASSRERRDTRLSAAEAHLQEHVGAAHDHGALRLELALPIRCSDGQFVGWAERVFIDEISLDSEPKLDAVPAAPPPSPPKPRRRKPAAKDEPATKKKASGNDNDKK